MRLRDFEVYLIYIDGQKCSGCGQCKMICPVDVFEIQKKAYPQRPENCLGCQACIAICNTKAIIFTEI